MLSLSLVSGTLETTQVGAAQEEKPEEAPLPLAGDQGLTSQDSALPSEASETRSNLVQLQSGVNENVYAAPPSNAGPKTMVQKEKKSKRGARRPEEGKQEHPEEQEPTKRQRTGIATQ